VETTARGIKFSVYRHCPLLKSVSRFRGKVCTVCATMDKVITRTSYHFLKPHKTKPHFWLWRKRGWGGGGGVAGPTLLEMSPGLGVRFSPCGEERRQRKRRADVTCQLSGFQQNSASNKLPSCGCAVGASSRPSQAAMRPIEQRICNGGPSSPVSQLSAGSYLVLRCKPW
jgi:hypothetical protein